MKSYEEMAQSALERIEEHNLNQKKRRKTAAKIIIPVLSLCIAVIAGVSIFQSGIINPPAAVNSHTQAQKNEGTKITGVGNSKNKTDVTSEGTTHETGENEQNVSNANGIFQGIADNNSEPREKTEMISSYPGSTAACYAAPKPGEINLSVPLRNAIEEYGDGVLYRVTVDIFDGSGQIFDQKVFNAEADRLFSLGCTCAIEETNDGEETRTLFTMHATAQQLRDFKANPDYGYMMFLYDE